MKTTLAYMKGFSILLIILYISFPLYASIFYTFKLGIIDGFKYFTGWLFGENGIWGLLSPIYLIIFLILLIIFPKNISLKFIALGIWIYSNYINFLFFIMWLEKVRSISSTDLLNIIRFLGVPIIILILIILNIIYIFDKKKNSNID